MRKYFWQILAIHAVNNSYWCLEGVAEKHKFKSQLENFLAYGFNEFLDLSIPQFPHQKIRALDWTLSEAPAVSYDPGKPRQWG